VPWGRAAVVAIEMRPTDFCTPKPFQLEHSYFAVSQRCDRYRGPFGVSPPTALVPNLAARAHPREASLFALPGSLVRRRANLSYRVARGQSDRDEAGEGRGSQRDPHFDDLEITTRRFCLPSSAIAVAVSGTPVASPSLVGPKSRGGDHRGFGFEAAKTGSAGAL